MERGIAFSEAEAFEWSTALILEDTRYDYGEQRFRAMGYIKSKMFALVYTMRKDKVRIISLRRANKKEEIIYEQTPKT